MSSKHLGRMLLSKDFLLAVVQYSGGKVHSVVMDSPHIIEIVIEHPSIPTAEDGADIPIITPNYHNIYGADNEIIRVERESFLE